MFIVGGEAPSGELYGYLLYVRLLRTSQVS
jgi:hypothetical protein